MFLKTCLNVAEKNIARFLTIYRTWNFINISAYFSITCVPSPLETPIRFSEIKSKTQKNIFNVTHLHIVCVICVGAERVDLSKMSFLFHTVRFIKYKLQLPSDVKNATST